MSWQLLYADTLTGSVHGVLPVESFGYMHQLNGAGNISARLPLESTSNSRLTNQVAFPRIEAGKLEPDGSTRLWVLRDGVPQWGGLMWTRDIDPGNNAMTIAGEGVLSYFRRRSIRENKKYSATDQIGIAEDLIEYAIEQPGGDPGVSVAGTASSGVLRDRVYPKQEYKSIGDAVEQLAAVIDGFDFSFDAGYSGSALVDTFNIQYPNWGRSTNHVFEIGTNVNLLAERSDGTSVASLAVATGAGQGPTMLRKWAWDTSKLGTRPLLEKVNSYSDVSVASTLQAKADLDLLRGSEPVSLIDLEILPGTLPALGSYRVGDRVRVKGSHGYFDVDATYRIVTIGVAVFDDGESVSLSLAPLSLFL